MSYPYSFVFIHGLKPNPIGTIEEHARDTWTAPGGESWLTGDIPRYLPRARVFLYGYNSSAVFDTGDIDIAKEAETLLRLIKEKRVREVNPPIIFVGYSLGGLVAILVSISQDLQSTALYIISTLLTISRSGTVTFSHGRRFQRNCECI